MIAIKVRGVIVHEWKLFLCKLADWNFFCLPGWTLEPGEIREQALEREIIEELNVQPVIWKLVYINEFVWWENNQNTSIDFWYSIENATNFLVVDITQASHGHEHAEVWFYDLADIAGQYKPTSLQTFLAAYLEGKETLGVE